MHTSIAHRRRRFGALLVGMCVAAGSIGSIALADSSASASVDTGVMVQAGMSPVNARQAATKLNQAIDAAAQTVAQAAAAAVQGNRPVRTTAAATRAFANEIDGALTDFAEASVTGLRAAGVSSDGLLAGTLAGLGAVAKAIPGAVAVTTGADFSLAGGADGAAVSANLNPRVDAALRKTISDSVKAIRPVLPLTRTTMRAVGAGVRQVVDAAVVAVDRILVATVDFVAAIVNMTPNTLQATRTVVQSAVAATDSVVVAVDSVLANLSDVNIGAQVDASLNVSAH
jgi:hypothetical protein